eukprot:797854-Pelagomonas_calceolata.AAC.2
MPQYLQGKGDRSLAACVQTKVCLQSWVLCAHKTIATFMCKRMSTRAAKEIADEVARVKAAGGWVYDGRVCNILAVSRAFGDWEFKVGELLPLLSSALVLHLSSKQFLHLSST